MDITLREKTTMTAIDWDEIMTYLVVCQHQSDEVV